MCRSFELGLRAGYNGRGAGARIEWSCDPGQDRRRRRHCRGGAGWGGSGLSSCAAGCVRLVLDRSVFPRDKVCGDFVGPAGLVELDALGVSRFEGYAEMNIGRRAAVHLDGKELISQYFPDVPGVLRYGRVIPRLSSSLDYAASLDGPPPSLWRTREEPGPLRILRITRKDCTITGRDETSSATRSPAGTCRDRRPERPQAQSPFQ